MKLTGPHMIGGYAGDIGHPPIAKAVNFSIVALEELRQRVGPKCLIVVRWTMAEQPLDQPQSNALAWFDRFVRPIAAELAMLHPLVIEGYNEIAGEMAKPYALFEMDRLNILHSWGLRGAAFSFSVGRPDYSEWPLYDIALDEMVDGDVLSRHEYWIDGEDLITNTHHTCRQLNDPDYIRRIPTIITEAGRDIVENKGYRGWRLSCSQDQIFAELRNYDVIMSSQSNIVGITPFTLPGDDNWSSFYLDSIWPRIVAEQEASGTPTPPKQESPQEEPQEQPTPVPVVQDLTEISARMRDTAWDIRGDSYRRIEYNDKLAFPQYAREHGCGAPITPEFDLSWRGAWWRGQGYALGIVFCKVGDWDNVQVTGW